MKPKLLVSVRSACEARLVSGYEIGIVDAKEPHAGSLGRVSDPVLQALLEAVRPGQCLSVALGELDNLLDCDWDQQLLSSFHYAKIGLSNAARRKDWQADLGRCLARLPAALGRVAVAYVDFDRCHAPAISQVVSAGKELGCAAVLLDTHDKSAGDLFTCLTGQKLRQIVCEIQSLGMHAVVAGSISDRTLAAVMDCEPDFVGVRGAICRGGRVGAVHEAELERFVNRYRKLLETNFPYPHCTAG
jgi:uncharacterized protein (UPF0264 family)